MAAITLEMRPIGHIKVNPRNARTHSKKQIAQIANSMKEFGNVNPIL
jgi:ParB-like chromosome segregation protein Spo0J